MVVYIENKRLYPCLSKKFFIGRAMRCQALALSHILKKELLYMVRVPVEPPLGGRGG